MPQAGSPGGGDMFIVTEFSQNLCKLHRSGMAARLSPDAAPTELTEIRGKHSCYKHVAPLELGLTSVIEECRRRFPARAVQRTPGSAGLFPIARRPAPLTSYVGRLPERRLRIDICKTFPSSSPALSLL